MGKTTIQLNNDTAANWATNNPVLAQGEMGLETDTNRIKFGNGTTAWNTLPYVGAGASFKYGLYSLSADQTSNLALDNHIEFNTAAGSLGGLSTGSGQANGIITLTAGKTYKITGSLEVIYSATTGSSSYRIYDRTNSCYLGQTADCIPVTHTSKYSSQPSILAFITPTANIDVDVRMIYSAATTNIVYGSSWLLIEEYAGY